MALPKILLRADGDSKMGLGHVYRCIAVAEILDREFECVLAIRNPENYAEELIDGAGVSLFKIPNEISRVDEMDFLFKELKGYRIVVLDGYDFDTSYQKRIKDLGRLVVSIDDNCRGHFYSDIIINHSPLVSADAYSCEAHCKLYLGPRYALLRKPFSNSTPKAVLNHQIKKIFISFGGADPNNFTHKTVGWLNQNSAFDEIVIVTGSAYLYQKELQSLIATIPNVKHFNNLNSYDIYNKMVEADITLVPSSTILFEALASGTVALSGYYVDNQKLIYDGFLKLGLIVGLGDLNKLTIEIFCDKLRLLSQGDEIGDLKSGINKVFDGGVRKRVLDIFTSMPY